MEIFEAIFLGIIQGLTEFLPVSSSAHLLLTRWLLKWPEPTDIVFDIALHLGTLVSVIWYFRGKLYIIARAFVQSIIDRSLKEDPYRKLSWLFILSTIPAALIGIFFEDLVINYLRSPLISASMLILVGFLLFIVETRKVGQRKKEDCTVFDALFIGVAQAIALIPGVSRSGITITAGLFRGLSRDEATEFSFIMAIPIIGGGGLIHLVSLISDQSLLSTNSLFLLAGFLSAIISGYFAIKYLLAYLQKGTFYPFVYYRCALGLIIILIYFFRG